MDNKNFLALTVAAAMSLPAMAQAVTIPNGSFEVGPAPGGFTTLGTGSTAIDGWTVSSGSIDYIGTYWNASEGNRSIDLNGNSQGAISTTITGMTIGQSYRLEFDLSGNTDGAPAVKVTQASAGSTSQSFNSQSSTPISSGLEWTTYGFNFVAADLESVLTFSSQVAGAYGPALDNVRISAVPVPAGAPLLLGGLGLFAVLRRKARRKA